nr:uncharacterized protein LOC122269149 [Parasteatoda tepidariorum]
MIFQCLFLVLSNFIMEIQSLEAPALQKPLMIPSDLRLGDRADIICTLRRGDLPVTFKWYFNGREIRGEELGKVTSYDVRSSVYLIDKLKAGNVGNYTCMVSNVAGSDTASGQLLVEGCNPQIHYGKDGVFNSGRNLSWALYPPYKLFGSHSLLQIALPWASKFLEALRSFYSIKVTLAHSIVLRIITVAKERLINKAFNNGVAQQPRISLLLPTGYI